jgi:hypothetical protein
MQAPSDLDELEVTVRRRAGRYLARIPQLGLYATGDSVTGAIAALDAKKKNLVDELVAANALDDVRLSPAAPSAEPRALPALGLFAAKGLIVVALVLLAVGYSRHVVENEIERVRAMNTGGAAFWADVEKNIAKAAEPSNDLSETRRQALLADLHVIVDRWRPFVREAGRLFSERDDAPAAKP